MNNQEARRRAHEAELETALNLMKQYYEGHGTWTTPKKKKDVVISRHEPKVGQCQDVPVIKTIGRVPMNPTDVLHEVLLNYERRKAWNKLHLGTTVIDKWQGGDRGYTLNSDKQKMPGPISPRDFCQIRMHTVDEKGVVWLVYTTPQDAEDIAPPQKPFVRATFFPGGYVVEPDGEGWSKVTICLHIKLNGDLPQALVNDGAAKELCRFYKFIREGMKPAK